jgi:hypothetical protein
MVKFEKAFLRTAAGCPDQGTSAFVASPDVPLYCGRHMASVSVRSHGCPRTIHIRELSTFKILQ